MDFREWRVLSAKFEDAGSYGGLGSSLTANPWWSKMGPQAVFNDWFLTSLMKQILDLWVTDDDERNAAP